MVPGGNGTRPFTGDGRVCLVLSGGVTVTGVEVREIGQSVEQIWVIVLKGGERENWLRPNAPGNGM